MESEFDCAVHVSFVKMGHNQLSINIQRHGHIIHIHVFNCLFQVIDLLMYIIIIYNYIYIYTHCRFIIPYTSNLFIHPDHLRHDSHKYTSTVKVNPIPSTKYVNIYIYIIYIYIL